MKLSTVLMSSRLIDLPGRLSGFLLFLQHNAWVRRLARPNGEYVLR
jgi:hypothetical protein